MLAELKAEHLRILTRLHDATDETDRAILDACASDLYKLLIDVEIKEKAKMMGEDGIA